MKNYGFIGTGNMGSALARSAAAKISGNNIYLANRTAEKAKKLAENIGANYSNNDEIAEKCDFIYICVKPQGYPEALGDIKEIINGRANQPTIVTMAAGISIASVKKYFPKASIIRIMPNTPVAIGKGVILYDYDFEDEGIISEFLSASESAGEVIRIKESDIDAASVISGCGPAFMYLFLDALAKAGEKFGLDKDTALKLAADTMIGAASLYLNSGKDPEELTAAVCSRGGSTIEGVNVFRQLDLDSICEKALEASFKRTKELGK